MANILNLWRSYNLIRKWQQSPWRDKYLIKQFKGEEYMPRTSLCRDTPECPCATSGWLRLSSVGGDITQGRIEREIEAKEPI